MLKSSLYEAHFNTEYSDYSAKKIENIVSASMRELTAQSSEPIFNNSAMPNFYVNCNAVSKWMGKDIGIEVKVAIENGFWEPGIIRKLSKIINANFAKVGIPLEAPEDYKYIDHEYVDHVQFTIFYIRRPKIYHADENGTITDWDVKGKETVFVEINGNIVRFTLDKAFNNKIRDNGFRQMCGNSHDELWLSANKNRALLVHANCVHPALGTDYTARLLSSKEFAELTV